ncbi:MAG: carotenoid 1,2-hydratase [Pseudomonadota bacterium]
MTDRGREALSLTRDTMRVGPSGLKWTGDELVIDFAERTTPHIGTLAGEVRIRPSAITDREVAMTEDGAHVWRPFAPVSDIEVNIDRPGWRWSGHGYFDANFGIRALEADFSYWSWGRYPTRAGAACFYDAIPRGGPKTSAALSFAPDGSVSEIEAPPLTPVRRSPWLVKRETRADAGYKPHQVLAMLDAPFYNRAVLRSKIHGEETAGVCEAIDFDKFASPLLKPMLAVRVPRRARWRS